MTERLYSKIPCFELVHPDDPSCISWNAKHSIIVLSNGVKLYLPLFAIMQLLAKRRVDGKNIQQVLKNVARSSLFLVLNGPGTMVGVCLASHLAGVHHPAILWPLATGIAYSAINVEKKGRRRELALYVTGLVLEALFKMGIARGFLRPIPQGLPLLFAVASGGLLSFYNNEPGSLGNVKSAFTAFVGDPTHSDAVDTLLARRVWPSFLSSESKWVLSGFLKMFGAGFLFRLVSSAIAAAVGRSSSRLKTLRGGARAGSQLGMFLGLFSALSRTLPFLLERSLGLTKPIASVLAGFIAGLSSLLYPSVEISLYFTVKLLDALFNAAVTRHLVTPISGGDSILFAAMTGFLFYVGCFEHACIRKSYWNFLLRMSGNNLKTVPKFAPQLGREFNIPQLDSTH